MSFETVCVAGDFAGLRRPLCGRRLADSCSIGALRSAVNDSRAASCFVTGRPSLTGLAHLWGALFEGVP